MKNPEQVLESLWRGSLTILDRAVTEKLSVIPGGKVRCDTYNMMILKCVKQGLQRKRFQCLFLKDFNADEDDRS
jgi:hypothetical protein